MRCAGGWWPRPGSLGSRRTERANRHRRIGSGMEIFGQPRRCLDVSRAEERFGFRARVPFDEGIQRTAEWWESVGQAAG